MTPTILAQTAGGFVLLALGGELLVRGAAKLAYRLGLSALVIGLTVVAFGTSAPEMVVSTYASFEGRPDIAVGNVVGSNVFNVLFILGACAVLAPLVVKVQLLRQDVPIMIGASLLMLALAWDGRVTRLEGVLLSALLVAYTWLALRSGRTGTEEVQQEYETALATRAGPGLVLGVVQVLAGLGLLVLGARWFVDGATAVARAFGVSELLIGLTLVAVGTSLPEVATSVVATIRGHRDIAIGNVVGSNILNVFGVAGISAVLAPDGLQVAPPLVAFDLPVMVAAAVACLPLFFTGGRLVRWEGGLFLAYYLAYVAYLVLQAQEHEGLATFGTVMSAFVLPLTGLTILVLAVRQLRRSRTPSGGG